MVVALHQNNSSNNSNRSTRVVECMGRHKLPKHPMKWRLKIIQGNMVLVGRWTMLLVVSLLSVDRSSAQTPLVSGISKPLLGGCTAVPTHSCTACRGTSTGPCQCSALPAAAAAARRRRASTFPLFRFPLSREPRASRCPAQSTCCAAVRLTPAPVRSVEWQLHSVAHHCSPRRNTHRSHLLTAHCPLLTAHCSLLTAQSPSRPPAVSPPASRRHLLAQSPLPVQALIAHGLTCLTYIPASRTASARATAAACCTPPAAAAPPAPGGR
jgi:hypothetical protein